MSENAQHASSPDPNPGKDYYIAVEPNKMSYTDGNGISRHIHLPQGKSREAGKLLMNQDWEALARFPTWTGSSEQQYSDKDFRKIPKETIETKT